MDFDPDGIAIMSTYKYGSWNLSHESANLAISAIRWLGLRSCELLNSDRGGTNESLLRLSMRDRKKAMKMLGRVQLSENGPEQEWRRELQVMLMVSFKGEMELLADRAGGVERWVEERLLKEISVREDIMDI